MKITSKIIIVFALMCVCATAAYSQDCNSYLKQAAELVSQKNYCDALNYYRKYRDCNADADVSTEIAMCEKRCKLDGGTVEPDVAKQPSKPTISMGRSTPTNAVMSTTTSSGTSTSTNESVSSAKLKLGLNGGILYPIIKDKVEGVNNYLFFGGGISAEYLVTPNVGIGLSAGYYGYQVKLEGGTHTEYIMPVALTGKYYFLTKSIQPYLGIDAGLYNWGSKDTYNGESESGSESFWGLAPVLGLQFKLSKTLALDINAKGNLIFPKEKGAELAKFLGVNVGLVYSFGK